MSSYVSLSYRDSPPDRQILLGNHRTIVSHLSLSLQSPPCLDTVCVISRNRAFSIKLTKKVQ
jgi:hypothetical protein